MQTKPLFLQFESDFHTALHTKHQNGEMLAEQLNCEASTITPETSFKDDLGADSLDLFELVMALEDEYNVEIPAEELTDLNTVGDVIDYLKNKGVEA